MCSYSLADTRLDVFSDPYDPYLSSAAALQPIRSMLGPGLLLDASGFDNDRDVAGPFLNRIGAPHGSGAETLINGAAIDEGLRHPHRLAVTQFLLFGIGHRRP